MRYVKNKSYTEFIREITIEMFKEKNPNIELVGDIGVAVKNNKNELVKITKALGMDKVMRDGRYKIGKIKIFPIHFQILSKVLLMQNRSHNSDFVYKLKHEKYEEIKETEIEKFLAEVQKEFDDWFNLLEFTPMDEHERNKKELDEIFLRLEEQMLENETTEYIDDLEKDDAYSKNEVEYLKTKFSIRQQENVLIQSIEENLYFKCRILRTVKEIHNVIDHTINASLNVESVKEKRVLLADYDSELIGTIAIPQIFIKDDKGQAQLSNKERCIVLEILYREIADYLIGVEECVDTLKESKVSNNRKRV